MSANSHGAKNMRCESALQVDQCNITFTRVNGVYSLGQRPDRLLIKSNLIKRDRGFATFGTFICPLERADFYHSQEWSGPVNFDEKC